MVDEKRLNNVNVIQNIVLENREKLNVTGINDILSFDDQIVILSTDLGMLTIKGSELKINKLNIRSCVFNYNSKSKTYISFNK